MTTAGRLIILFAVSLAAAGLGRAELSKGQIESLFRQANEAFRRANSTKSSAQAAAFYENAILNY